MKRWMPLMLVGCASAESGPDFTDQTSVVDDCQVGLSVGECPPDFTLNAANGGTLTLSDHVGERIIIIGTSNW